MDDHSRDPRREDYQRQGSQWKERKGDGSAGFRHKAKTRRKARRARAGVTSGRPKRYVIEMVLEW